MVWVVKNPPPKAGDIRGTDSVPGLGRSPGGGHGNPLQYFCLENPRDRGAWRVMVHGVAKSQTWLKRLSMCKWMVHLSKHWYNTVFYNTAFIQNFPLFPLNPFFYSIPFRSSYFKEKIIGNRKPVFKLILIQSRDFTILWVVCADDLYENRNPQRDPHG